MFFFFKQKTGYEMRISDWSSDVCSSDLAAHARARPKSLPPLLRPRAGPVDPSRLRRIHRGYAGGRPRHNKGCRDTGQSACPCKRAAAALSAGGVRRNRFARPLVDPARSEEHTSELQSLMRISYAVFCLKKQN